MRHKGKRVSFDTMVKFFMQSYNIPTQKDVDKLMNKLDHITVLLLDYGLMGVGLALTVIVWESLPVHPLASVTVTS